MVDDICNSHDRPAAAYCVRDIEKREDKKTLIPYHSEAGIERVRTTEPGSDWRVAHFLFKSRSERLLEHPSLELLRAERVRTIILVDDVSMSGTNIGNFLSAFHGDPRGTLRSWYSMGLIRYHIVLHTLGAKARCGLNDKLIRNGCRQLVRDPPELHVCREEEGEFTEAAREFFEATKHMLSANNRAHYLGYRKSLGRTVFAHGCPNNVPAVFWDSDGGIQALFPNRVVPTGLLPLFRSSVLLSGSIPPTSLSRWDLLVLREVKDGARTVRTVAGRTGLSLKGAEAIVLRLRRLGLVVDVRLTPDGRRVVEADSEPTKPKELAPTSEFYYRRSRGGQ